MSSKGIAFVLSAPSGTGKTTLSKALLKSMPELEYSISATTRPMRPGEVNGKDYYFYDEEDFLKKKATGEFLESANVYGYWYGTPKSRVEKVLASRHDILIDVDVQGASAFRKKMLDAVYIFLVPPSLQELKKRLQNRKTEDEMTLNRRLFKARDEMRQYFLYDYIVINDNFDEALQRLQSIVLAEKSRRDHVESFVQEMLDSSS
jgi:guanylate kinase